MSSSVWFQSDLRLQSRIEVTFPVIATIGVLVRLYLRHRYKIALLWDDALIVVSCMSGWALWAVWYWTTVHLIGSRETALLPTTPPLLRKLCLAMDFLYGEGINVVKFAILFFYLRAFGSNPNARVVRFGIWCLFATVGLYAIARAIETTYLCPPICEGATKGYSVAGWQFAMRAINWVTEFVILLFPIPILWEMMISTKSKIGIYICFFLGIVTCAASAGRLVSAIKLYQAQNAVAERAATMTSFDQEEWFYTYYIPQMSQMTLWSLAELNIGIITATLPAVRSPAISLTKSAMRKIRASWNITNALSASEEKFPMKASMSEVSSPTDS